MKIDRKAVHDLVEENEKMKQRLTLADALALAVRNWNEDPTQHWINEIVEAEAAYRESNK